MQEENVPGMGGAQQKVNTTELGGALQVDVPGMGSALQDWCSLEYVVPCRKWVPLGDW